MTSISSLTGNSSSTFNGKITGLASGMDTDSIIAAMTSATLSKIGGFEQKQTVLQWQMDAYREVTSSLLDFSSKFDSVTSSSNLSSSSAFSQSIIDLIGENSKYITTTGTMDDMDDFIISSVDQLAQNASITGTSQINDASVTTGEINFVGGDVCLLEDQSITFKYDDKDYTVTIPATYKDENGDNHTITSMSDLEYAIDQQLAEMTTDDGTSLSSIIKVSTSTGSFVMQNVSGDTTKNLSVSVCTPVLRDALGLGEYSGGFMNNTITAGQSLTGDKEVDPDAVSEYRSASDLIDGSTLTLNYNGKNYDIELKHEEDMTTEEFVKSLQTQINNVLGTNRINVSSAITESGGTTLAFTTMKQDGTVDYNTKLSLTGDSSLFGPSGVLNVDYNANNSFDTSIPLSESNPDMFAALMKEPFFAMGWIGINSSEVRDGVEGASGKVVSMAGFDSETGLFNDGSEFDGLSVEDHPEELQRRLEALSLDDIMGFINAESATSGFEVAYSSNTNSLIATSTIDGAAGDLSASYSDEVQGLFGGFSSIFFDTLFGEDSSIKTGQDAIITVDYDGYGGADPVQITSNSNDFTFGSLNVTVNGVFTDSDVQIKGSVDAEGLADKVQEMVDAYNDMIDQIYGMVSEKPDSEYFALTDDMKADMTAEEIERWETEAKKGLLYQDSTLISLANDLRSMFYENAGFDLLWEDIGITSSTDWAENGKLSFDASKFEEALASNPDMVEQMFTSDGTGDYPIGIIDKIGNVIDKYASTTGSTKGILIELAGHESSPLSLLSNSLLSEYNDYESVLESLRNKLEKEEERYTSQFTALELYISQMNSQSSWLYSQFS